MFIYMSKEPIIPCDADLGGILPDEWKIQMHTNLKQSIRVTVDLFGKALERCVLGRPATDLPKSLVISAADFTAGFVTISKTPELLKTDDLTPIQTDEVDFEASCTKDATPRNFDQDDWSDAPDDERLFIEEFQRQTNEKIEHWNAKLPNPFKGQVRITCDEILQRCIPLIQSLLKSKSISCNGVTLNDLGSEFAIYSTLNARNIRAIDRYRFAIEVKTSVQTMIEDQYGKIPNRKVVASSKPTYQIRRLVNGSFEAYRPFRGGTEKTIGQTELTGRNLLLLESMLQSSKEHEEENKNEPSFEGKTVMPEIEKDSRRVAIRRLNEVWQELTQEKHTCILTYDLKPDVCTVQCRVSEKVLFDNEKGNFGNKDVSEFKDIVATDGTMMFNRRRKKHVSVTEDREKH